MRKLTAVFASAVLLAVIAAMSFFTGELIGTKSGYAYGEKMAAPMEAAYLVSVLNLMESGMHAEAAEMLEVKLDTHILSHWSASRCRLVSLNPFLAGKEQKEMFYPVIAHRKSRPSVHEAVGEHLRRLEEGL